MPPTMTAIPASWPLAGAAYALSGATLAQGTPGTHRFPPAFNLWPWEAQAWHPDRRPDLALLAGCRDLSLRSDNEESCEMSAEKPNMDAINEWFSFLDRQLRESPRGRVLIFAARLDESLMEIIQAALIEGEGADKLLKGFNAPLGTFASRTEIAHAMGLITDDEHHNLTKIRRIRNEFAHNHRASFSDQNIKDYCNLFRQLPPSDSGGRLKPINLRKGPLTAGSRFTRIAFDLTYWLSRRPQEIKKSGFVCKPWPTETL